jgi:hypothetical protein
MTVCIAAECDGGEKIVVAADRMFTLNAPMNLEFETGEKKIEPLAPSCVVLSSGNSAYAKEMVLESLSALAGSQNPKIARVVDIVKEAFIQNRAAKIREQLLIPMLGPDFLKCEKIPMTVPQYLQTQPGMFNQLSAQMFAFNTGMDFLVCGVDDTGARIAYVGHPGTVAWLDKLGYAAIGSGGIHATTRLALGSQTRNSALTDTLYRVYEAKKAAEVAPGVGKDTDMAVVTLHGTQACSNDVLAALNRAHGARNPAGIPALDDLRAVLDREHANA